VFATAALSACASLGPNPVAAEGPPENLKPEPFASTYARPPSGPTLIRGATVLDGAGGELANADVVIVDGKIQAVGASLAAPEGATIVEAAGKFVTPGIIDAHSHLGVYPSPGIRDTQNGNEATGPNTAEVWAEHSVWPMDPGFQRAVAGGVTTLHILPGSANLMGGRGVTLRPVLGAITYQAMKFPGAPQSLKMACGENPARVYGGRNQSPSTHMANVAGWREAFSQAQKYQREWAKYEKDLADAKPGDEPESPPDRDLQMETLVGVLDGKLLVQWHCYRSDEMITALGVADEFGFKVSAFHHAVEAYKIADQLASRDVCAALWADWWGFKIEAYDSIRENVPFVHAAGGCAIVHSDSAVGIQRLNQEAAKALADGRRAGLTISRGQAWTWLSRSPARALGIEGETGTLAPGKAGDVVIWSADPFSVYAVAERVYMDGALVHQRGEKRDPPSDFELGQTAWEAAR
jgi:imidazolonepropionase-like amidohydrolase